MTRLETRLGPWIIKYRWLIIVLSLFTVVAAGSGMKNLRFSNDTRAFFSKENPQLQAFEALESTYTKNENVLFVVIPDDGSVFTNTTLAAVRELTERAWKIPYSSRVDSLSNFQNTRAAEDELIVEDLVPDASALSKSKLQEIRRIALNEPLLVNRIVSPSGHVTGVNVSFLKPGKSLEEVSEVTSYSRNLAQEIEAKYPSLAIRITGGVIIDNAFGEASEGDMKTLIPLMFALLLVIMGISLRSFSGTMVTFMVIAVSMVVGMGLAGWLGVKLTPGSANAPTIILTLAVADSIHLLITMFNQMRQGKSKDEAIAESLRINLQPVFLTSLTTAIGFLTMNFSDAPPFHDLGNIVAMGVTAAFFFSLFLLPAVMAVLPIQLKKRPATETTFFQRFGEMVVARRKMLFFATLAGGMVLISGIFWINLDDNFIKYFDQSYTFRQDTDFTQANLTGMDTIEYSLSSGEPGGINNPAYLHKLEEFANWYRQQPGVIHVNVLTDIFKRLNKNLHNDDDHFYTVPESRELAAQYLLLYEMSLPFGLDLNNRINVEKSATRMTVTMRDASSKQLREMDEEARAWLREHAPVEMFAYGTGLSIMFAHISERNIHSMLNASLMALVIISLILMAMLRSFKIGLLSLLPNLLPALMAFGIWGMTAGEVGLAVSVMFSMTLGIVVDDTVHFLSKYQRARNEYGMSSLNGVHYAFQTVGAAMLSTTIILVAGFVVLSFSGFKVNSDMGIMTTLTITLALVMDFLFLPVLLMLIEEKKDEAHDLSVDPDSHCLDNEYCCSESGCGDI